MLLFSVSQDRPARNTLKFVALCATLCTDPIFPCVGMTFAHPPPIKYLSRCTESNIPGTRKASPNIKHLASLAEGRRGVKTQSPFPFLSPVSGLGRRERGRKREIERHALFNWIVRLRKKRPFLRDQIGRRVYGFHHVYQKFNDSGKNNSGI